MISFVSIYVINNGKISIFNHFKHRKAAEMLQEGDTVFMDASSTVLHIADYLHAKQNLTVITNSIKMLEKLKGKQITCYLTGGMLLENSHALVGNVAEETISSMYADICFFSSQGITEDGIITDFSDAETKLRKQMIRNAKKAFSFMTSQKSENASCLKCVMQLNYLQ